MTPSIGVATKISEAFNDFAESLHDLDNPLDELRSAIDNYNDGETTPSETSEEMETATHELDEILERLQGEISTLRTLIKESLS